LEARGSEHAASTSRHIQPKPLTGFDSSSTLPTAAKILPPRKSHSSISSWSPPMSARKLSK